MSHLNTKFVIKPDWPSFDCILHNVFGEGSNSAIVSGRIANLIMISEKHWKNEEILFQNAYGHRESVVLRVQTLAHYILFFLLFVSLGPFHDEGKCDFIVPEKLLNSSN